MKNLRTLAICSGFAASLAAVSSTAFATHISTDLDVNQLWTPMQAKHYGYLNFVEPGPVRDSQGNIVNTSGTEEYTGWVDTPQPGLGGTGATPDLNPPPPPPQPPTAFDNGLTHGDRVDFDFVVENRVNELNPVAAPVTPLHPGTVGYLSWEIAPTQPSTHIDPATGLKHTHDGANPIVPYCSDNSSFIFSGGPCVPDYNAPTFDVVDVFSIIADPVDANGVVTDPLGLVSDVGEATPRDAALDYVLDFCNIFTGQCAPGTPILVFIPGWTNAAVADDYVARWASPFPATHVFIDPTGPVEHPDQIVQIDAIIAYTPEPATLALMGLGLAGMLVWRRRS
ncbi:MAG: PEP-CTERM sorting domain-containing protein [Candidatus Competibacteraceae bacterium]